MIQCTCMVQEGQVTDAAETQLRADMQTFVERNFGSQPQITWTVIGTGNGFTAAKPSNSVIIAVNSDRAMERSEREPLLRELGDMWIHRTGLTGDEVVTVIRDPRV